MVYIYILISVILWGFSFVWTNKLITLDIPVFTFIFFRMMFAALIMSSVSLILKKFQKIESKDIPWFILMALFEPFIYFLGETYGLKATNSPTLSSLIIATIPIFAMLSGIIIYKERITKLNILGVLITLPGILLMVLGSGSITTDYWWGIALLMLAVFSSVGFSTVVKRLTYKYNSYTITSMQFILGSLLFLPLFLIFNNGYQIIQIFEWNSIKPLLALAILCSSLCFFLYTISIKEIGITRTSIFSSLMPGVSAIGAFLYGYESFSFAQIGGIIIVILGVIFTQLKTTSPKPKQSVNA